MVAGDDALKQVQDVLNDLGYHAFRVKKLELVPADRPMPDLDQQLDRIVETIMQRLEDRGHGRFHVKALDLTLNLSTHNCGPDEELRTIEEVLPDGTRRLTTKCVKK
jgi:hypothetical protein